MRNFVAILAAGKGSRMGLSQPKQFEMLNGKTILEHSIDTFEKHSLIEGIFVVVHKDFMEKTKDLLKNRKKIFQIVEGGDERTDSSYNAILAVVRHCGFDPQSPNYNAHPAPCIIKRSKVKGERLKVKGNELDTSLAYGEASPFTVYRLPFTVNLLIHDAARPFITEAIITRTVTALEQHNAVSVAIPATDTIYLCNGENEIETSPNRNRVYLAQTPQAARLQVFKQAFDLAKKNPKHIATDDANVILQYLPNEKIHIVLGDIVNRKITYAEDLKD